MILNSKCFLAEFTRKIPLLCVDRHVECQVAANKKSFVTEFTPMGLLICVNPDVGC
jgi:hypothetical protein